MDFDFFLIKLEEQLVVLFESKWVDLKKESKEDIDKFIKNSKEKLERWTILLSENKIDIEDYKWLVKSQKDMIELRALYSAGISKISLGHVKNKIVNTILEIVEEVVI